MSCACIEHGIVPQLFLSMRILRQLYFGAMVGLGFLTMVGAQNTLQTAAASVKNPANLDTDSSLIGWWKFEETTGREAADSSPAGHPGTLEGGLSFATNSIPGRVGRAIKLLGNQDFVRIAGFKGITGTNARTVTAWIKTTATEGDIATWGTDDAGKFFCFGHIRGRIGVTPKSGYRYMKTYTNDDAWHHVAVVVQGGSPPNLHDDVSVFKDGELAEIDDIGLLDLLPFETGDQQDVRLGPKFKGALDEVRIYRRALTEEEIQLLAHPAP
jgi:hypothetical protein